MADDGCREGARVVIASNRGPVSFGRDEAGSLTCRPGAGGLASALSAVTAGDELRSDSLWVCAALSDGDRSAARSAPGGHLDFDRLGHGGSGLPDGFEPGPIQMLDIDPETYDQAYNGIANSTLWFVHHLLFDPPNTPVFDEPFRAEWRSYVEYNRAFAQAIADSAAAGARVVVQDYHLSLVPKLLRELRPDLRIAHFSHTPWAPPDYFALLPDDIATAILEGLLAADHLGFLSARWADAFVACCTAVLGAEVVDERVVSYDGRSTGIGVHPLGVDAETLRARVDEADVLARMEIIRASVGDRRLIVRVDRAELSKNIVRGLLAYRDLLRQHPEWVGRVVHLVFAYKSRHALPEYREYAAAVRRLADEILDEFGRPDWTPLVLATDDDLPRSLAAYRLAEVAIVNPIRDGMNLVAKEISIACDSSCALVLSREAGAADELGTDALLVNPFDVDETAEALHSALSMPLPLRREHAARLAAASGAYPPARWLADQLSAL